MTEDYELKKITDVIENRLVRNKRIKLEIENYTDEFWLKQRNIIASHFPIQLRPYIDIQIGTDDIMYVRKLFRLKSILSFNREIEVIISIPMYRRIFSYVKYSNDGWKLFSTFIERGISKKFMVRNYSGTPVYFKKLFTAMLFAKEE